MSFTSPFLCAFGGVCHVTECLGGHLIISHSWTLIAHATSEIVVTCPDHPMLMLSLLGVALIHGLYAESKTFLRSFLTALFRSPRHGIPPPITHPMHPSYLVELCNEWTRLARTRANAYKPDVFPMVKDERIDMQLEAP